MPNDAKIIVAATHDKLHKVRDHLAIAGTINALDCIFEFRTDEWSSTAKTAVFVAGQAVTPVDVADNGVCIILDDTNECAVPAGVIQDGNTFSVGVYGSKEDYRIVSNWLYFKIKNGAYVSGSTPLAPAPSVYEQLLEKINELSKNVSYTKEEIDELLNISDGVGVLDAGSVVEAEERS